jgi:hypothetical protein
MDEDLFGGAQPSPATAKGPVQADHLQPAPGPSPVPSMATLNDMRDVLRRLSYGDMIKLVKGVETHKKNNTSLAEALALWADSE